MYILYNNLSTVIKYKHGDIVHTKCTVHIKKKMENLTIFGKVSNKAK